MNQDAREILQFIFSSMTLIGLWVHMYLEEKREQRNAEFKADIAESLRQLVLLNNTFLPWVEKAMSQEEKDILQELLDDYKG